MRYGTFGVVGGGRGGEELRRRRALPIARVEREVDPARGLAHSGVRIYLSEGDPPLRERMTAALRAVGHGVTWVPDAFWLHVELASAYMEVDRYEPAPAVVVTEAREAGCEALASLRAFGGYEWSPGFVVLIDRGSAVPSPCAESPVEVLRKPFTDHDLRAAVATATVERERRASACG